MIVILLESSLKQPPVVLLCDCQRPSFHRVSQLYQNSLSHLGIESVHASLPSTEAEWAKAKALYSGSNFPS